MTLSKIAKLANVSVSTVSKAFSESNEINEQTKKEIFNIAKQLGCFKKYYNAKYPKFVIAVICPEFKSSYYSSLISIIEEYLSPQNCEIVVAQTNFSKEKQQELLDYYNLYTSVDGIILIENYIDLKEYEIPIITVAKNKFNSKYLNITTDLRGPLLEALRYFKSNNVTEIGFIGEEKTIGKFNIFAECMTEVFGTFENKYISVVPERFECGGYKAAENLLKSGNIPRAIICAYDNLAIGAIRFFKDHNLNVPDDIAILGIDDIRENEYLSPSVSSINCRPKELYKIVCEEIINILNGNTTKKNIVIEGKFVLRESTKINTKKRDML